MGEEDSELGAWTWEGREGRLLAYELVLGFLVEDHTLKMFKSDPKIVSVPGVICSPKKMSPVDSGECPHTKASYYGLILGPHTSLAAYYARILHICHHSALHVSSYSSVLCMYMCPHSAICVLILLCCMYACDTAVDAGECNQRWCDWNQRCDPTLSDKLEREGASSRSCQAERESGSKRPQSPDAEAGTRCVEASSQLPQTNLSPYNAAWLQVLSLLALVYLLY